MKRCAADSFSLHPSSLILSPEGRPIMLLKKIRVRKHERGLWFRHGEFRALLEPGVYCFAGRLLGGRRDQFTVTSTLSTRFEHPLLDTMLAQPHVRDSLH